mgnify:CR=1 FL=1
MKLGRDGGASLPPQAGADMANALQKGIASLAAKHGKNLEELQKQQQTSTQSTTGNVKAQDVPAAVAAWDAAKENYKSPSQRSITQETFDEVVNENIEDFDMELKEAIADACLQFMKQGVNLNNIVKTEMHFNLKHKDVSDHPVTLALSQLKEAIVAKETTSAAEEQILATLENLKKLFDSDEEAIPIANSKDAIGTTVTLLRTVATARTLVPTLQVIKALCNSRQTLDQFHEFGLGPQAVLDAIGKTLQDLGTEGADKALCTANITAAVAVIKATGKHSGCKDIFYRAGFGQMLDEVLTKFPDHVELVKESALAFRSIVLGLSFVTKLPACC